MPGQPWSCKKWLLADVPSSDPHMEGQTTFQSSNPHPVAQNLHWHYWNDPHIGVLLFPTLCITLQLQLMSMEVNLSNHIGGS